MDGNLLSFSRGTLCGQIQLVFFISHCDIPSNHLADRGGGNEPFDCGRHNYQISFGGKHEWVDSAAVILISHYFGYNQNQFTVGKIIFQNILNSDYDPIMSYVTT